jgi:hypothetical protein
MEDVSTVETPVFEAVVLNSAHDASCMARTGSVCTAGVLMEDVSTVETPVFEAVVLNSAHDASCMARTGSWWH